MMNNFNQADYDEVEDYKDGDYTTGSIISDDGKFLIEISSKGNWVRAGKNVDRVTDLVKAALTKGPTT